MVRLEKKKRGFYIIVPSMFWSYLKRINEWIFLFFYNFIIFFQNFLSIFSITFFWLVRFKKRKKRLVAVLLPLEILDVAVAIAGNSDSKMPLFKKTADFFHFFPWFVPLLSDFFRWKIAEFPLKSEIKKYAKHPKYIDKRYIIRKGL